MVSADFDGDGLDEVAVAQAGGSVVVFRTNGGTLQPLQEIRVGGCPSALAAGRVSATAEIDLVVAHGCNSTLSVLLGRGDGTFRLGGTYRDSRQPVSVAVQESPARRSVLVGHEEGISRMEATPDGELREPTEIDVGMDVAEAHLPATTEAVDRLLEAVWTRSREPEATLTELTGRQREVAVLAAAGLTAAQIGRQLFISRRTVETHLEHIYRKLGVNSRLELASLFRASLQEPVKVP